jgi:hypothetical protein
MAKRRTTKRRIAKKHRSRRPRAKSRARAPRIAHSRTGTDEPIQKVAPWRSWIPVALSASSGTDAPPAPPVKFTVSGLTPEQNARYSALITSAAHKHFKIVEVPPKGEGPAAFLVGLRSLRVIYNELVVQFERGVPPARCRAILAETGFREVRRSSLVKTKWIVRHTRVGVAGAVLLAAADSFAQYKEVRLAWPSSVGEYRRAAGIAKKARRWWLDKIGVNKPSGKRLLDKGKPSIVIAVLDDGVDINHPNLSSRVDPLEPGKDFAIAVGQPGHDNPSPKVQGPTATKSDYHGTLCAGVICSDGKKKNFLGVAPGCRLVAVRVIDGPELINETWLADAISWATSHADVISCSWVSDGDPHADVVAALNDTALGRGGKGTAVFCAAGNNGTIVAFPARHGRAIAVGACDSEDGQTDYSNCGDDLDIVAPSSNGITVYTTDVSKPGWGFNTGGQGDPKGFFHDEFGQTSAATAIAAGVGALCLCANSTLTADELRCILQEKAVQIGAPAVFYNGQPGHSQAFGYGRIDAGAAVAEANLIGP